MAQSKNIGFAFEQVVKRHADQAALIFEDMTLTYAQLWKITCAFARKMAECGVRQGDFVVVDTTESTVSIASLLASALLGAKYANSHEELALLKRFRPTHYFHSPELFGNAFEGSIEIEERWTPQNQPDQDVTFSGSQNEDEPWLIVHTSGSTGLPKYIGLSHAQVYDRSAASARFFKPAKTVFCSLFACYARPYISRILAALLNGATIVESRDPSFWVLAGVNLVMGSPLQVKARLDGISISPKIPALHVGGGALDDDLATNLLKNFETVVNAYGASETNHSYNNIKVLDEDGDIETYGEPLDSLVEIVNRDGQQCALNETGRVRIQNPYLASGYLDNSEAQEKCFIDGWFYPGDLANWGPRRTLNFVGREDHVINLGGAKVNALAVDEIMRATIGISDAICFKNPKPDALNELLAFAVFDGAASQIQAESSAKFACEKKLGEIMVPKRIRPINEVPRLINGAPDRETCAKMVLERAKRLQKG